VSRGVTLRRVGGVLATLLLIAAVVPFVVFAVPQVVGADHGFVVLSGSMEPALSPGDVVIVDASAPVRVGDVITYAAGAGAPTTHRVVGTVDGGYETKGDANENVDAGVVAPDATLGRVVLVIPLIGHVILWANTPAGYVALIVIPLGLLAVNELVAWARRSGDRGADVGETDAPIPAIRRIDDGQAAASGPAAGATEPTATTASSDAGSAVAVAVVDLKLTLLAMGGLFAYAGWNVYREYAAVAAPNPVSVGALTAGLLGLLFAGWVTVAARRSRRNVGVEPPAASGVRADGGADVEVADE
jgi:signal peptidase